MITQNETTHLVNLWLELWNGDTSQAERFISPDFHLHAAMMGSGDSSAIRGPEGLVGWISQTRAAVPDLTFSVEIGPIVQDNYIALRWRAQGGYGGGMPGATAPAGTPVLFTGTDILRVEDDQLAEYWVNSDTLVLLTQLGVIPN